VLVSFERARNKSSKKMTIGEKYFILLSKVAAIQQQIDELKPYWDNERDFVNKVRERFDELEKFMLEEWLAFRKVDSEDDE